MERGGDGGKYLKNRKQKGEGVEGFVCVGVDGGG